MPRLITRSPRTRQPQGPLGIDRSNPLSRGLRFLINGATGIEHVSQGMQATNSATKKADRGGVLLQYANQQTTYAHKASYDILGDITIAAVVSVDALTNYGGIVSKNSGTTTNLPYELRIGSQAPTDARISFTRANASAYRAFEASTGALVAAGDKNAFIAVTQLGTIDVTPTFYVKTGTYTGSYVGGAGGGAATSNSGPIYLGKRGDAGTYLAGGVLISAGWDRVLSAQELASFRANPWQLLAPVERTIWVPSAGGAFTPSITEAITLADTASQVASLSASITEAATLSHSQDAIVGYAVSKTETLNLSHSQTNVANFPATITEAMTLADSGSVQFGATSTISEAMTLADSSSNVATLSASITESMTLADSPNASASGDYTATQTEAMTLADTASNVAALSAAITEPMSLADSSSNVAALSRSISEALTLADTVSSSAAGDYTATITEPATLADSSSNIATLSAAITESVTLADTLTASSPGNFAASISESLALAEIASNQAALSAALVEALSLSDNAASAWSRVVSLTEAMTLSDSASQALNAIVTESVWWSYSIEPQDLHYSVDPQDLTFSITTLALAGG